MARRELLLQSSVVVLAGLTCGGSLAHAQCAGGMNTASSTGGSGPPSLSITEASTTDVLELVRRRKSQMLLASADDGTLPAAETAPEPPASQSSAPQQSSGSAAKATKPKKAAPAQAPGEATLEATSGGTVVRGAWGQAYVDYEKHDNIAPGQQENPDRKSVTSGGMLGMDWSRRTVSGGVPKGVQVGVFGGYNNTDSDFSRTQFFDQDPAATRDLINRDNSHQEVDGGFTGGYLGYLNGKFSADLVAKFDFFDLSQKSDLTSNSGCTPDVGFQRGSADLVDYIIAGNLYYRYDLSRSSWFEPSVGARVTITDYSNDRNVVSFAGTTSTGTLGLDDGEALRLQIGGRYGEAGVAPSGWLWSYTVGAFLYSDVAVDGLTFASANGGAVSPVDEGKVRVLGQFVGKVNDGRGSIYSLAAEVRGGEDLFGIDGMLGYRYEW